MASDSQPPPSGMLLGEIDVYSQLMDKESRVLQELNDTKAACNKRIALDATFFSMTLQEFIIDYTNSISDIVKKLITTKNFFKEISNKEIFYIGVTIVLIAIVVMLGECSR